MDTPEVSPGETDTDLLELSPGKIDRIIRQLRARHQKVKNKEVLPLRLKDCRALLWHISQGKLKWTPLSRQKIKKL